MSIIATCGHDVTEAFMADPDILNVVTKRRCREGERTLSYEVMCLGCQGKWADYILRTEDQQEAWMRGEGPEDSL